MGWRRASAILPEMTADSKRKEKRFKVCQQHNDWLLEIGATPCWLTKKVVAHDQQLEE